jgi:ATP-binding cassette, subfamily B, bacterial MsbA
MKAYLRVLSYAESQFFILTYCLFTLLHVLFSTINFSMLIPLLDVLFQNTQKDLQKYATAPEFSLSISYFIDLFYHYFVYVMQVFGKLRALQYICGLIMCSVILSNIFRYISNQIVNRVRIRIVQKIRNHLFNHLSSLHIGYFSNERKGDLLSRLTNDVQEMDNSLIGTIKQIIIEPLRIVIYFCFLLYTSVELTLFTVFFLPVSGLIVGVIVKNLKRESRKSQETLGSLVNIIDEMLFGLKIIKAFNAKQYIANKFWVQNEMYSQANIRIENKKEWAGPASETLSIAVVAGILMYGGSIILGGDGSLDASSFITYLFIFSQMIAPLKVMSGVLGNMQKGIVAANRVFDILDTPLQVTDKPQAHQLTTFADKVEFKAVSFAYNDKKVLQNIGFELPKGKTVALVGVSGGGKSTLVDLLPRFYDVQQGEILIDNHNIKDCDTNSLRKLMGIVTQESILFNDTIYNNIAFGNEQATQEEVEQAAKIANAHQFIIQTENGYQTNIGDRGNKLSGGQRQRLCIARAVLKNPPILILDEATSALDSESEKLVQEALSSLMKNRTALVIAHRLSTIQNADEILVLKAGEIIERGNHETLLHQNGAYRKLIEMQSF